MENASQENVIIARNIAYWRKMHDLTPEGAIREVGITLDVLKGYETGEKPVLARHLFKLAEIWGVPISMFNLDHGDNFYKESSNSDLKYGLWALIQHLEDYDQLEKALGSLQRMHDRDCWLYTEEI